MDRKIADELLLGKLKFTADACLCLATIAPSEPYMIIPCTRHASWSIIEINFSHNTESSFLLEVGSWLAIAGFSELSTNPVTVVVL
jgi:hypothetical protein